MIDNLVEYLRKCSQEYYNSENTLVSDATYDAMLDTLRRLDPTNAYLKEVGARVPSNSNKVGRLLPMGTLSKFHKEEEVVKWLDSEGGNILVAPKYDGFAVELLYQKGELVSASTRGDGNVGEDVLAAMKQVATVPSSLSDYVTEYTLVRGEAIIPKVNHEKVKSLGYTAMRNAVPGIIRSCREDALSCVDFVAYEFIDGVRDRVSQRNFYNKYFRVEDYEEFNYTDIENMDSLRHKWKEEYPYEIDGVVLKTISIKDDNLLTPSHMIAWKYKSNREITVLRGIEYQLGVTGYFTPIGIFDPVEFQGATLTRASLGNMTRLLNEFKGMTIGSLIEVSRRGDIIPYIEGLVLIEQGGEEVVQLTTCPHCGAPLAYKEKEPHCVNRECPEKLRLQIIQYVSSVGIKGIGDKLVRGLIDAGHLHKLSDLYSIDPSVILELPRQGQSSADKWKTLQGRKLTPVELLTAYPFIDLGRKVWETVLSRFSFSSILRLQREDLVAARLKGIGDSKVESIISQVSENREELEELGNIHGVL